MNWSRFTPPQVHTALSVLLMTGIITAGLGMSAGLQAQSEDSGFPRESLPTAKPAEGAAPAPTVVLPAETQDKAVTYKGNPYPPRVLHKQADGHYTPYQPPVIPKEGPQPYIIAPGDTLWDLGQKSFGSPLYWPLIWEGNEYIKDAHWIYPGDPLWINVRVLLPGDNMNEGLRVTNVDAQQDTDYLVREQGLPPVYERDMYCAGYIDPEFTPPDLRILVMADESRDNAEERRFVFLNHGKDKGLSAGQEFFIIRPGSAVNHPTSGSDLGLYVRRVGRGRITIIADNVAVMEISLACSNVRRGDFLLPFEPKPAPFDITRRGEYPLYIPPNGKMQASVVLMDETGYFAAEHSIAYLNVGSKNEIVPGDRFMIYRTSRFDSLVSKSDLFGDTAMTAGFSDHDLMRDRAGESMREEDMDNVNSVKPHSADKDSNNLSAEVELAKSRLPRKTIGEIVVLDTTGTTATCRVIHTETEMQVGDTAELE